MMTSSTDDETKQDDEPLQPFRFRVPFSFPNLATFERTPLAWLQDKRKIDNIGELWRVHDNLYDFQSFITLHPGGADWLVLTRGTDITEVFEASHIGPKAEMVIKRFYVEKVSTERNSLFTFKDDGFYRTLKRKAAPSLKEHGQSSTTSIKIVQDLLLLLFLTSAFASAYTGSFVLATLSGFVFSMTLICAHNFVHLKDNWRMYIMDMWLISHRDWRLSHVLSHHVYPNTRADWELVVFEPTYVFFPTPKSWLQKYGVVVYFHFENLFVIPFEFLKKMIATVRFHERIYWHDLIPLIHLLTMVLVSSYYLLGLCLWLTIHFSCSYWFMLLSLIGGHRHPEIFIEGDTPRENQMDWGIYQLDSVRDRPIISGNIFVVATLFGDHGPHHLFPTVDHSKLPILYPIIQETCQEFGVEYKFLSQKEMFVGLFKQLRRTEPNTVPPGQNVEKS